MDPRKVLPDEERSLLDGAIFPWQRHGPRLVRTALGDVARRHAFALDAPLRTLAPEARQALLEGDGRGFPGVLPALRRRLTEALILDGAGREAGGAGDKGASFAEPRPHLTETVCAECGGARLRKSSLAVRLGGRSLADYVRLPVDRAQATLAAVGFAERERPVADRLMQEILSRLGFLEAVGLGYLSLDRPTTTLSGGEAQRLRLAGQIGARMQGILYVLDEPSVGLHARDNERLLGTLKAVRDLGNTVVVVEHDAETIRAADTWWTWAKARACTAGG